MNILVALTYYRPHYSGLTVYADRLVQALARRGHHITVLTSRFNKNLPSHEVYGEVEIIRPDVLFHISKGVIMPAMPVWAMRLIPKADIVHLHAPQFDAAPIALTSRLMGKPVVLTYHCDLHLPAGLVHYTANQASSLVNHVSALASNVIVTNTRDYAENSSFLRHYLKKLQAVFPPVELATASEADREAFRQKAGIRPGQRIIGMAARLATEKGVEYLLEALPSVLQAYPTAHVLFVGQYQNVMGEEAYARKLAPMVENLNSHWTFLGNVTPVELSAFFKECELTVLPSINSTESFGMVQVESMVCGTPVVSTDLPGVRQPVTQTGMGQVVPARDPDSLAKAIKDVLDDPAKYQKDAAAVAERFSSQAIAARYEEIFRSLLK